MCKCQKGVFITLAIYVWKKQLPNFLECFSKFSCLHDKFLLPYLGFPQTPMQLKRCYRGEWKTKIHPTRRAPLTKEQQLSVRSSFSLAKPPLSGVPQTLSRRSKQLPADRRRWRWRCAASPHQVWMRVCVRESLFVFIGRTQCTSVPVTERDRGNRAKPWEVSWSVASWEAGVI